MKHKAAIIAEKYFKAGNTVKYAYIATKLHRKFASTRDETLEEHQNVILFNTQFSTSSFWEIDTGETGHWLIEQVIDLNWNYTKPRVFRCAIEKTYSTLRV